MKRALLIILPVMLLCITIIGWVWWEQQSAPYSSPDGLPIITVQLNETQSVQAELANSNATMAKGLMHRKSLEEKAGMWFDFGKATRVSMWMKNTLIPLDMLFVDEKGVVQCIAANTVPHSLEHIICPTQVRYVLEINAGKAAAWNIEAGDVISWEKY